MKTTSCWGNPPSRLYHFINRLPPHINDVCIVGCSDGKFVFPFLRKGYRVTAIDIDKTALYGGMKQRPIERKKIEVLKYVSSNTRPQYDQLPTEAIQIDGLWKRCKKEHLTSNLNIIETDFYRNPPNKSFDVLFTSCSLQYKTNRSIPLEYIMNTLKNHVEIGGFLYMDYMMPLEDTHDWKSDHFFRSGQIKQYFSNGWKILYNREMHHPIFEAAHIDRPEDHFHRFGYILARKNV